MLRSTFHQCIYVLFNTETQKREHSPYVLDITQAFDRVQNNKPTITLHWHVK